MHKHGFDDSVVPFSKTSYWYSYSFSNFICPYFNHLCSHIYPAAHRLNCGCNLSQISLLTSSNIHVTRGKVSCPRTEIRIRTANSDWDSNSHPFQITSTCFFFFFWGVNHYGNDIPAPSNSCRPSPEKLVSSCSVSALWWTELWGFSSGTAQSAVSRKRAQLKPVARHAAVENSHWSASGLVGLH